MTTAFRTRVVCQHCGKPTTAESAFERWFRGHPQLESRAGIVRFDLDILLHRYMFTVDGLGDRRVQCMMFIEVKTHGAKPSAAQVDTLSMLSQMLLNGKTNKHRRTHGLRSRSAPHKVWSKKYEKWVTMHAYGGHLLRIEGGDPMDSAWMEWDGRKIDLECLVGLLKFEKHPYSLQPMDKRRRYAAFAQEPTLFNQPEKIGTTP